MYQQVADRTLRSYRLKLRQRASFTMELKTLDGVVEVYFDAGGKATMKNPMSGKFNLSLGSAEKVLLQVERHDLLPYPTALSFHEPLPDNFGAAINQVIGFTEPTTKQAQGEQVSSAPASAPVSASAVQEPVPHSDSPGATTPVEPDSRDAPNARKVIEAALAGEKHLRAKRDVLRTLPDGSREWEFTRRHQVDGKWQVAWREVVVQFFAFGGVSYPPSVNPVVLKRQKMLSDELTKRGTV